MELMRSRTKEFSLAVIKMIMGLKKCYENRMICNQLFRSSTSVAANYRAATRARSDAEFYSKICIVVEEADESLFWLKTKLSKPGSSNSP
jgi:four helix bundle protein